MNAELFFSYQPVNPAVRIQDFWQNAVGHALNGVPDELGGDDDEGGPHQEDDGSVGVQPEDGIIDAVLVVPNVGLQRFQSSVDRHRASVGGVSKQRKMGSCNIFLFFSSIFLLPSLVCVILI